MHIQIAEWTAKGKRQNNEDSTVAAQLSINGQDLTLLGVFDGVGGHADGEVASRIAADTYLSLAPEIVARLTSEDTKTVKEVTIALAEHWRSKAAKSLHQAVQHDNKHPSMATTAVAAAMLGESLAVWWLGDSRAYLFRDGKLRQLTTDHSTVAELNLSEEDALEHPHRNQITRFLRATANDAPEVLVEEWRDGDVVMLVSDGVSGSLTSWELETFLAYMLVSDITAQELAAKLLTHIEGNQSDNASIALAIRGVPKPLGEKYPQVPLASLLSYGLAPDVLQALTSYPANSAEWLRRDTPPWRQLDNEMDGLLNPGRPTLETDGFRAICPECREWVPKGDGCKAHPDAVPFEGTVVEVLAADGSRSIFPAAGQLTLTPSGADLAEVHGPIPEQEIALEVHPQDEAELPKLRIRSPLGAHLQTYDIEILPPLPSLGLSFKVQNNLVVIRHTASGPLQDAPPVQVRQVQDQETKVAAIEDSTTEIPPPDQAAAVELQATAELAERTVQDSAPSKPRKGLRFLPRRTGEADA